MKDAKILTENGVNVTKALELFESMEVYDETLVDFLGEVDDKLSKAQKFMQEGLLQDYAIFVHSLKTGARYLGFEVLGEMAFKHEMESKAGNYTFVTSHFQELVNETNKAVTLAKRYLGGEVYSGPVDSVQTPEPVTEPTPVIEAPVSAENTKPVVLVADDSIIITNLIKKTLGEEYEIIVAADGKEAIDAVSQRKIDAFLLDLNMPNVSGFDVLDFMKTNNLFIQIPVSIISGNDSKDETTKAFTYPIVDMLSKPFNERDVKSIVERTINAKK